jgi:hypothetical protein
MKEISSNIFKLLFIYFTKPFFPKYINEHFFLKTNKYKKQIFFECGGGYWSYYCGIVKMIKETYSREELNKIIWLGSSAGVFPAVTAAYLIPDRSMNNMLKSLLYLPQTWYGGICKLNPLILNNCHQKFLLRYKKKIISKQNKLFLAVLDINIICPLFSSISFYYNFDTMQDFTESCLASHGIPFITGPLNLTCFTHPKKWYIKRIDAGVFTVLFGYLFGYSTFMPYGTTISYHVISANIFRRLRLDWGWLWPHVDHNKKMYELGYQDAIDNREMMDKIIL